MPGYLTNRYISFDPASEIETVNTDLTAIETRVSEAEDNIDDLSLNLGV